MPARFCRARAVAAIEAPHWTEIEMLAAALPGIDVVIVEKFGIRGIARNAQQ